MNILDKIIDHRNNEEDRNCRQSQFGIYLSADEIYDLCDELDNLALGLEAKKSLSLCKQSIINENHELMRKSMPQIVMGVHIFWAGDGEVYSEYS